MASVLVVDDETSARERLYDGLRRHGHDVVTAGSGAQALEVFKSHRPNLVLLDTTMPGLSGVDTAAHIRTFDDAIPILFLKAADEPDVPPAELMRAGVSQVFRKDADPERIVGAANRLLDELQRQPRNGGKGWVPRTGGTVVVADDDASTQRVMQAFLQSNGLRAVVVGSGEEAVQALSHKPILVLLDLCMTGMDGLVTLRKIKAACPTVPVIMISGVEEQATAREAIKMGAYDYITKPFNLEYLETVVLTKVLLGIEA